MEIKKKNLRWRRRQRMLDFHGWGYQQKETAFNLTKPIKCTPSFSPIESILRSCRRNLFIPENECYDCEGGRLKPKVSLLRRVEESHCLHKQYPRTGPHLPSSPLGAEITPNSLQRVISLALSTSQGLNQRRILYTITPYISWVEDQCSKRAKSAEQTKYPRKCCGYTLKTVHVCPAGEVVGDKMCMCVLHRMWRMMAHHQGFPNLVPLGTEGGIKSPSWRF